MTNESITDILKDEIDEGIYWSKKRSECKVTRILCLPGITDS